MVAGDRHAAASETCPADPGEQPPDSARWLAWALILAAVAVPAAAAGLAGVVVTADLALSQGVHMAFPGWLWPAGWVASVVALGLSVSVWRWRSKPWGAAHLLALRLAVRGLQVASLLCALASALVPS